MFLTLQRLITQSNKFFLRETIATESNLAPKTETDSSTTVVETDQGEAMQTLQQQLELAKLEQTVKLPFLVERNNKERKIISVTCGEKDRPLTNYETNCCRGNDENGGSKEYYTSTDSEYDD